MSIILLFLFGALGALAKDILEDGKIRLPKKEDGDVILGSLGGMIVGGVAGFYVDGSPTAAFLAGFAGTSAIQALLAKPLQTSPANTKTVEQIIRYVATEEGVSPDLAVRVAKCESSLIPSAKNINTDGSCDRGLFQINDKCHPEIDEATAFDIVLSTRFFCKAFKDGHMSWWDATKKCWNV
jgi:hypothetical protein